MATQPLAVVPVPASGLTDAQLADEFGEVRLRMMAWKPAVNPHAQRFSELSEELLRRQENQPAAKQLQVEGHRFIVPISPRRNESKIIDPLALFKRVRKLGLEQLMELYTITLDNARKVLSKKELPKYIRTERTGNRTIGEPVFRDAA